MKAIAYGPVLPLEDPASLIQIEVPTPEARDGEILVRVYAVSVNPVDGIVRRGSGDQDPPRRIGWDAAGVVESVGAGVTRFAPGDRVFYCGSFDNPTHAEFNAVDERLVGHLPDSVSFEDAAGLPLVFLTAWQALFQRLPLSVSLQPTAATLLITAGAGGVGSAAVQLATRLTGVTVIATASREESADYARRMGAHHVIDHSKALAPQLAELAPGGVDYILSVANTDEHIDELASVIAPMGDITIMDNPESGMLAFKGKSVSVHMHNVFTRSSLGHHPEAQGRILDEVGRLLDRGVLQSTVSLVLDGITPDNERAANRLLDTGRTLGKIVLSGLVG